MKKSILIVFIATLLTSCSHKLFNFTLISTKTIELEKLSLMEKSSERTKSEDKAHIVVIIPTRKIKIDQAISNAIDGIPGCVALLDGVVYSKFWFIPYIYGQQKFVIEATPLVDPAIPKSANVLPEYGKMILDKKGQIKSIKSISEIEFASEKNHISKIK